MPGDEALELIVVQPGTYEFETEYRETVRSSGTDDEGQDLVFVYAFADAEDGDANRVDLSVSPEYHYCPTPCSKLSRTTTPSANRLDGLFPCKLGRPLGAAFGPGYRHLTDQQATQHDG